MNLIYMLKQNTTNKRNSYFNHRTTTGAKEMINCVDVIAVKVEVDTDIEPQGNIDIQAVSTPSTSTSDESSVCLFCDKILSSPSHLKRHTLIHTGEKPFQCSVCQKSFNQQGNLKFHIRQKHSDVRPFKCGVCDKGCKTTSHLKQHMLLHTGEKPYACANCHVTYTHKYSLRFHKCSNDQNNSEAVDKLSTSRIENILNDGKAKTSEIDGILDKKDNLTERKEQFLLSTDCEPKICDPNVTRLEYKCELCPKVFYQKSGLTEHTRVHTRERPYPCQICGRGFSTQHGMRKHTLVHTGERPHTCDVCGRHFRQTSSLLIHKRIHTGENSAHKCPLCDVVLRHKSYVSTHMTKYCKNRIKISKS